MVLYGEFKKFMEVKGRCFK